MTSISEKMEISRDALRVLLLHEFRLGTSARETASKINGTMGPGTTSHVTASRWFKRFANGNFELEDASRSGRPSTLDLDAITASIIEDPKQSPYILKEKFKCSQETIRKVLHQIGKTWKYGAWIPHELSENQRQLRSDLCMFHLTSHNNDDWLTHLITGDEKWVMYVNYCRKRQWLGPKETGVPTPKPDRFSKKVMIACWWNYQGVIHWSMLPSGTTMNSEEYCSQLEIMAQKLHGKQRKVHLLHDNAKPHVSLASRQKIMELGWNLVPHPPYSPDLSPTDYHLFRSLANHLEQKTFENEDHIKTDIQTFFDQKSPEFYKRGIYLLPKRWKYVVESNGDYVLNDHDL